MAAGDLAINILLSARDNASGVIAGFATGPLGGVVGAAIGATTALAGIGVASLKSAGDFQAGMTRLVTTAGESTTAIGTVSAGVLKMSIDTATSTDQLSKGMYYVESAGYHAADGLKVMTAAAQGAKAENADLMGVASTLTTVMHDYGMGANQATNAMNGLIAAVSVGKTTLSLLSTSLGYVLPVAASAHVSFQEISAAISTMTEAGMSAQRASQNLANALRSLEAPSGVAQKWMMAVNLSAQKVKDTLSQKGLAAAIDLISNAIGKKFPASSVDAVEAFKGIMGGATGYNVALQLGGANMATFLKNTQSITEAMKHGGDSIENWALIQSNFNFKVDQAKSALGVLLITIGNALLPIVGDVVSSFVPLVASFTSWVTQMSQSGGAATFFANILKNLGINMQMLHVVGMILTQAFAFVRDIFIQVGNIIGPYLDKGLKIAGSAILTFINTNLLPMTDALRNFVVYIDHNIQPGFEKLKTLVKETEANIKSFISYLTTTKTGGAILIGALAGISAGLLYAAYTAIPAIIAGFIAWAIAAWAAVAPTLAVVGPIILIVAAVAALVAGFIILYNKWTPMKTFIDGTVSSFKKLWTTIIEGWNYISKLAGVLEQGLMPLLLVVGNVIKTVFMQAFNELAKVIKTQIVPIWNNLLDSFGALWKSIQSIMPALQVLIPVFKFLGLMILGTVVLAIISLGAMIAGLVKALGTLLVGLSFVVKGVIQLFTGFVNIIAGVWQLIADIISSKDDKIRADLDRIGKGIVQVFAGMWNIIKGLFIGTIGTIWSLISGFATSFVQIIIDLYNKLVGHSIIPDLVNGIVKWFVFLSVELLAKLISMALGLVNGFVKLVNDTLKIWNGFLTGVKKVFSDMWNFFVGWFTTAGANFSSWGTNLLKMFSTAMTNGLGFVTTAATGVANIIKSILGIASPAQSGPLSSADTWMPNMMNMIVTGIKTNTPQVNSAMTTLANGVNTQMTTIQTNVKTQTTQITQSLSSLATQITQQSAKVQQTLTQLSQTIKSQLSSSTGDFQKLSTSLNGVTSQVSSSLLQIQSLVQSTAAQIASASSQMQQGFSSVQSSVSTVSSQVSKAIDSITQSMGKLSQTVQSQSNNVSKDLSSLSDAASKYMDAINKTVKDSTDKMQNGPMKNFLSNFDYMVAHVAEGAMKMAQFVADLLKHSVPKKGPLSDDDKWGDHFVDNFVNGLKRGVPKMQHAANLNVNALKLAFLGTGATNFATIGQPTATPPQPIVVTIDLDGKVIGKKVTEYQGRELRVQGNVRNK